MLNLGQSKLWSFTGAKPWAQPVQGATFVRSAKPFRVKSFFDLTRRVAELNFRNLDLVLMFRGQGADHKNPRGHTTLKPTLFRPEPGTTRPPGMEELKRRYAGLIRAEAALLREYASEGTFGLGRLRKHRMLRWALLQHYRICATPLLDVTQSLRVAASFASGGGGREAIIQVLGVPNLSGAITASAAAGVQIIRLSSVCPPEAVRPHIQEGYLLGEYPDMTDYDQKGLYGHFEIDFGRRLVAKFSFNPKTFWKGAAGPCLGELALYPDNDPLRRMADKIKKAISREESAATRV